jgi:hypothetical protein
MCAPDGGQPVIITGVSARNAEHSPLRHWHTHTGQQAAAAAYMQAACTAGRPCSGGRTWTICGQLLGHEQCQ